MSQRYSASALIEKIKLKGFISQSTSLSAQDLLVFLNDSLTTYIQPWTSTLRTEMWVGKANIELTTDSDGFAAMPASFLSTTRTVAWKCSAYNVPLTLVEPENTFNYQNQSSLPVGFTIRGYSLQVLPPQACTLVLTAMLPLSVCVLEEDAAEVDTIAGNVYTLASVPLEWQANTPAYLDVISSVNPFSTVVSSVAVTSLVGNTLTLATDPGVLGPIWVANVNETPFPNLPIELFPLLELDALCAIFMATGDKRFQIAEKQKDDMHKLLTKSMAPRMIGNARLIVNNHAVGMNGAYRGGWYRGY
jgi:hypothetical protein